MDGPEAMLRVASCTAAVFLVAESGGKTSGLIRAVYDGSRALIHQLSVHPDYQNEGVGNRLIEHAVDCLIKRGAPSVSVTVNDQEFWLLGPSRIRDDRRISNAEDAARVTGTP